MLKVQGGPFPEKSPKVEQSVAAAATLVWSLPLRRRIVAQAGEELRVLDFGDLVIFTKVVETESFTKAGNMLGFPKSKISRQISRLEEHLGSQLLQRSTRAVTVTQDGALFFEYCLRSLGVLRDGERALQTLHRNPQGVVRIAIPYVLGHNLVGPLLAAFLEQYPDVRLVSVLTDDGVGLLRNGFDVALTVGPLANSGLFAAKLGTTECGAFGAPEYFERKGMPRTMSSFRGSTCSPPERMIARTSGSLHRGDQVRLRRVESQARLQRPYPASPCCDFGTGNRQSTGVPVQT